MITLCNASRGAHLTSLLALLISLGGCRKVFYKEHVIGTVYDAFSYQPIANVKVYLLGANSSWSSSGAVISDQSRYVVTGSDGKFEFDFNRTDYSEFYLYPLPENQNNYFSYGSSGDLIRFDIDKRKPWKEKATKDIYLKPKGFLKIRAKRVSSDTAYAVGFNGGYLGLQNLDGTQFSGYYPKYVSDTSFIFILNGNETQNISFAATLKDISGFYYVFNHYSQMYIPSRDTAFYQFDY